jgi:hypothetical protein
MIYDDVYIMYRAYVFQKRKSIMIHVWRGFPRTKDGRKIVHVNMVSTTVPTWFEFLETVSCPMLCMIRYLGSPCHIFGNALSPLRPMILNYPMRYKKYMLSHIPKWISLNPKAYLRSILPMKTSMNPRLLLMNLG